jgi:hypothetical protein
VAIENTGLAITNRNFGLEVAPKGTAPTCSAVSSSNFSAVPSSAACGSAAVCMTASANVTNDADTTDHLVVRGGQFTPGKVVANTTNLSTDLDIDQNQYTELEYVIRLTENANDDAYCFRVTEDGDLLDSYNALPQLNLTFDPVIGIVTLNNGADITLTPGATTTIIASTTVTDFNGFADLARATTTFYTTGATAGCAPNDNNCYIASGSACSFTNCSGATCDLVCRADFQFHAEPTDADGVGGQAWFAFVEVADVGGAVDFVTSSGAELLTLRAISAQNAINYGIVGVNANTGTFNPAVDLLNVGNEAVNVNVAGTAMSDGVASNIPASQQRFATSTFDYAACAVCITLSEVGTDLPVDLPKPMSVTPPVADTLYWGVEVPFGTASNPHTGFNTFTAIGI